ncbi:MAG: bifunctional serine/threonine-protein kinase/formylglycine-generating enzyme family protein [Desulfobacteraceae bacterium]|jgi:serine/threonine protein kinase|nr:bifunctional serine/threonine-protein kinase/formylglycine-generating enzyme family protein [Desulfobacteraceae bacterium]
MNNTEKTIFKSGTMLGDKWVILEFIAKGGMGEVYRAHQTNLNRDVAIKVISKQWLKSIVEDDEELETALQRFKREVQAMGGIHHPNVLQIFDYGLEKIKSGGIEEPLHYIAMEFIPGGTLRETMSEEGFYPEEGLTRDWIEKYFLSVLYGVEAVHQRDMVHRDLKPENVLIDGTIPKITDFGLTRSCRWKGVTQSMDFKGTIMYMAPEQLADFRRTDHRADIYSLGKILYEALVGKISTTSDPTHFKCVGLKNPATNFFKAIDQIIQKATAENKEDRYISIEEFRNAILKALIILKQQPGEKKMRTFLEHPKWIWTGISVAILSVLIMTTWHLLGNPGQVDGLKGLNVSLFSNKPHTPDIYVSANIKEPVLTEDSATIRYVPGGTLTLPEDRPVAVKPFYMDETPVTNLQYVSFLNEVRSGIRINNNVVLGDENIWLMLGEVTEGYEPIICTDDEFSVKHPGHAACPVLRVTAFGAMAYAQFYGKRLPSEAEWIYAYHGAKKSPISEHEETFEKKPILTPVILLDANPLEIRGLNQCINEWTIQSIKGQDSDTNKGPHYMVIGNARDETAKNAWLSAVIRQPWESFEEVGFRCAMDISEIDSDLKKNKDTEPVGQHEAGSVVK